MEYGTLYLGGPHAAYDLDAETQASLIAVIKVRERADGWRHTHAGISPAEMVRVLNPRANGLTGGGPRANGHAAEVRDYLGPD